MQGRNIYKQLVLVLVVTSLVYAHNSPKYNNIISVCLVLIKYLLILVAIDCQIYT